MKRNRLEEAYHEKAGQRRCHAEAPVPYKCLLPVFDAMPTHFNNNNQHFINVYSANPNGLEVEEINNNIYESIKRESVK